MACRGAFCCHWRIGDLAHTAGGLHCGTVHSQLFVSIIRFLVVFVIVIVVVVVVVVDVGVERGHP